MFSHDLKGVVIICFAALLSGFLFNSISSNKIQWIGPWDGIPAGNDAKKSYQDTFSVINNPFKMKQLVAKKDHLVLDARIRESFVLGHIPGAESMPVYEFDKMIGKLRKETASDKDIVVYCSNSECHDSHILADKLVTAGFENVKVFKGGMLEWEEMGFDVEHNE